MGASFNRFHMTIVVKGFQMQKLRGKTNPRYRVKLTAGRRNLWGFLPKILSSCSLFPCISAVFKFRTPNSGFMLAAVPSCCSLLSLVDAVVISNRCLIKITY